VQREKIDLGSVCKSLIRGGNGNGWVVDGIILYLVPSAIQLACVNSPVFKVEKIIYLCYFT
jgi:hypothetical protein